MQKKTLVVAFCLSVGAVVALAAKQEQVRVVTADVAVAGGRGLAGVGAAPMPTGNGVIFGQVKESESNRPVAGAIVTINLPGAQPLRVMADAQGRFGFRNLPKGNFNINATRPGWVDGAYGRTRPGGPLLPLILADGERVSGVSVPLWRYAAIAGRIVDDNGDPLVNVPVRVLKRSTIGGKITLTPVQNDQTDDRGMYRLGTLEPGDYVVVVPIQQPSQEIMISGEGGVAGRAVAVRAAAPALAGGGGDFFFFNGGGSSAAAGVGEDGRPLAFPTVFYPNVASSARATLISVTSGEERSSVDFQLKGVPVSKLSGVATGPEGPVANLQLTLVPAESGESATSVETLNGFTDGQGRFTIEGVPPGQYILRGVQSPRMAMAGGEVTTIQQGGMTMVTRVVSSTSGTPPLPTQPTLWTEMTVGIGNRDVTDLSLSLRPGVKMTGMVQFDGSAERPAADRISSVGISLEPADQRPGISPGRGRIEASGSFATVGVPPGRYFVRVQGGYQGWTFQSAMVNGRDASVVPVEFESGDLGGVILTFTDRPTELSGRVETDGPPEASTVLIFPTDQAAWTGYGSASRRFQNVRADKTGNYKATNLPAGEYYAVAIPDKMANDWQNPKFLETLVSDATRVRIRDNEKATASLKVTR